jgi:tetratricopeptide (TPR) repeat protein
MTQQEPEKYSIMKRLDFRRINAFISACTIASLGLMSPVVLADENEEVVKLYQQGNLVKALEQADAYLATRPKDAQMRFSKGLILTEQKKTGDAIKVFTSLSEDYPDLPEPYNNLAVLYAGQGQYDKAKEALEAAIRTHPSYSTAHENLGDIYAKMASQAYGKALQLDNRNAAAQTKLAMIKGLFANRSARTQTVASAPATSALADEPRAGSPEKTSGKTAEKAVVKAEQAEKPVSEKTAAGTAVAEKPSPEKQGASGDTSEIIKTVNAWAKAWSDKDVTAYLAFYATDFRAPGGVSRASWEKARRERILKPKSIHVAIVSPRINAINDTHARVTFKQSYHSDAIKSNTLKTLELVKTGDTWLINQENVGR